jgi:hypothetical protein
VLEEVAIQASPDTQLLVLSLLPLEPQWPALTGEQKHRCVCGMTD